MANNSLTGVVPYFSSMKELEYVMLYSNHLEAGDWTFFSSLANCTQLLKLNVGDNNLSGDLPANSIANLPKSMTALTLRSNNISGTISLEIGNLSSLSMLYLDTNLFMGPIPFTLGQLRNLVQLSLSKNKFSGEIPPSIGDLHQLEELYLQENRLSGSIPESLASCQNLVALNLSCNTLGGSISGHVLGSLNQLSWLLDLSHNQLAMSLPLEMGSLINLGSLEHLSQQYYRHNPVHTWQLCPVGIASFRREPPSRKHSTITSRPQSHPSVRFLPQQSIWYNTRVPRDLHHVAVSEYVLQRLGRTNSH